MKTRAAVLIGVRKTGQLQPLRAVEDGIRRFRAWVDSQPGFATSQGEQRVLELTDTKEPVETRAIRDAVKKFVGLATVEQLFIYFAGHGLNVRFSEYWLLSGAPDDPGEAVNLRAEADRARYCGIPHVVFISDACRSAANSIQSQAVEGSPIFPNPGPTTEPGFVDIFYASTIGRPALEVRDANVADATFEAVYTRALVDALSGKEPSVVQSAASRPVGLIHPWPLQRYLSAAVPSLLLRRGVTQVSQRPDATITSHPEEWLSEVQAAAVAAPGMPSPLGESAPPGGTSRGATSFETSLEPRPEVESLVSIAQAALNDALHSTRAERSVEGSYVSADKPATGGERVRTQPRGGLVGNVQPASPAQRQFQLMRERVSSTPASAHFETRCGFEVHGVDVISAASAAPLKLLGARKLRVSADRGQSASVLVVFEDGRGTLLPAIPGFVGSITYDPMEHEITSLEYEPSDNTPLFQEARPRLSELRALRRTIAAAAGLGAFRLTGKDDASGLVTRMRDFRWLDPALAVYAAHALHDLQSRAEIVEIAKLQRQELGLELFDVWMFARRPTVRPARVPADVFPQAPLLSQGWDALDALNVVLPGALGGQGFKRHVTNSLWTLFDEFGVVRVRDAIESGELR